MEICVQNLYRVRFPSGRIVHSLQDHTVSYPLLDFRAYNEDIGGYMRLRSLEENDARLRP